MILPFKHLPASERRLTLSTVLTLARIALVPCIVLSMLWSLWGCACLLFVAAAITDALDGALARWRNEQTFLGACLDPLADKFLVVCCFFTLALVKTPFFSLPIWFVMIVLIKEIVLISGAFIMYRIRGTIEIRPTFLGKATTVIQMCFIMWLFACYFFAWAPLKTYYIMLGVMISALCISLVQYIGIGIQQIGRR